MICWTVLNLSSDDPKDEINRLWQVCGVLVQLKITKHIRAPKEYVYRWWTDLREDDAERVVPLASRNVVKRSDDQIVVEDVVKILGRTMKYLCKVDLYPPSKWVANYSGKIADATSTYMLFDEDGYTRMEYSSEIKPKGIFTKLALPLVKFAIKRIFSKEMDEYNSRLEAEWRT